MEEEDVRGVQQSDQLKKYALRLLRRWPFILIFFLIAMVLGYAVNRYSTPVYLVKARITTKKFSDKSQSPIPGLVDANFFLRGVSEVYEEIPILKSPARIAETLDRVNNKVRYFSTGVIKDTESLKGNGYVVKIDTITGTNYPYGVPIYINFLSDGSFQLKMDGEWESVVNAKTFKVNDPVRLGDALVTITKKSEQLVGEKYYFIINNQAQLVNEYARNLSINWSMKGSSMLDLSIESELPERELKFLNTYFQVVEEFGLREKNETLDNTIRFIDDQMKAITDSLLFYQSLIDEVKLSQSTMKMPMNATGQNVSGSDLIFTSLKQMDNQRNQIELNERYFNYLVDYFQKKRDEEVFAPSLMGLNIPLVEGWVNQFIQEKLKEKHNLNEANSQNPLVSREDSLRRRLEKGIYEAIASERQRNREAIAELDKETRTLLNSVNDVQVEFRELAQYQRLYQLNQTLFDLFIRRKTEAAISKASAISDYKIIDAPTYSKVPILPNKDFNLLMAAALGLLIPIGFFLFRDITNHRIMDKDDLTDLTQIPLLGNVAHSEYPSRLVMRDYPRSVVAESFRAVRANLKFLMAGVSTRSHTFLVTSSIGGEGKTFCTLNLSFTLALAQRKTIVIGADLRKPELGNYLQLHSEKGLSGYLAGRAEINDIIIHSEDDFPDVIDAGRVPPNPAELLGSQRMKLLMDYLKEHYDYILIDTPPIGLVSDAMELLKYSDYNILIVRQGVTPKSALGMVNELYADGKLLKLSILFNDIELFRKRKSIYGGYIYGLGYGGYGYGYYDSDNGQRKMKEEQGK